MTHVIKKAVISQLPEIMEIIAAARKSIGSLGIPQWQNGYPQKEVISEDIDNNQSYAVTVDEKVKATFALVSHEPDYDAIYEGKWLTDGTQYTALHRIAVSPDCRGTGISAEIIEFIKSYAKEHGSASVRCDTHEGNLPMRKMLEKNGFKYCGVIHLTRSIKESNPDYKRVAYEFVL